MAKLGPLTRDELMLVWAAAVDKNYRRPLQDAGDGNGLEVYSQAAEQLARVSEAIDTSTQALYILPHSGQTAEPAGGERKATVALTITRHALVNFPLLLAAGSFIVEEQTTDADPSGPIVVTTGRKYITTEDLVFHPGEMGPLVVDAEAEHAGWGYNNPLAGTLSAPVQVGSGFTRTRATLVAPDLAHASVLSPARGLLKTVNEADTFVPEHVGQSAIFISGLNAGHVVRVMSYEATPDPATSTGSVIAFDVLHAVDATVFAGAFVVGEVVNIAAGGGFGVVLKASDAGGIRTVTFRFVAGAPVAVGAALLGATSGATLTTRTVLAGPVYVAEAPIAGIGGAEWRVLDWLGDWGLEIANAARPSGGRLGVLDELGAERDLGRASGEQDDNYRQRIATLADVVSPNALKRSLSRALGSIPWVFREVGSIDLRGFFYDSATDDGDAYDSEVYVFTGVVASGVFRLHEPCVLVDVTSNVAALGYFGRLVGGVTLTFIVRPGSRPFAGTGWRVRGLVSGAIFTTTNIVVPASNADRRFRRVFDYEQFRAFFLAEVARLGMGEFGFAYDSGPTNAYDVGGAFDGFPAEAASLYLRAYQALDQARAGGVGFILEQTPAVIPPVIVP